MKRISIPALATLTIIFGAFAQTKKSDPKLELTDVKATGCTVRPNPKGCLFLKTLDGKTTYNIVSVDPVPEAGIVIIVEAKPHQGSATCKQGIAVDVTRWQSTGEQCAR